MPRTRRLRSSNISEDVITSIQLDSDDEPILKSQKETRTRSSIIKNSQNNTNSKLNTNKRITRQTTLMEFMKPVKIEESSDTSDCSSIDNSKANKSMGMKCPRPDLKPIKATTRRDNSRNNISNRRETRQSAASTAKKRQKIASLSSGESDTEYESFSEISSDEDIVSRGSEYHSSYTDVEEDESETDETELNLSDSVEDNINYVSSDETQLVDETIKEDDDTDPPLENMEIEINEVFEVEEDKNIKKKGKRKREIKRKPLTEEEKKEKEERLKRIEETVNRVLNNPNITLSEESMKPRPRYSKVHPLVKLVNVNETVQMVIDEVADKDFKETSQPVTKKIILVKQDEPGPLSPTVKSKKKNKSLCKESKKKVLPVVESTLVEAPSKSIILSTSATPEIKSTKIVGRRGRPPGSPNKKRKAPELQKFLQTDYSKVLERPGITEPIVDESNPDKNEISTAIIKFRKLMKSGTINKQSIKDFKDLHESLCHVVREVIHEHDSLLRLVPNDKCRANDIPKIKKRILKAIGDKVSDKFIRKALKGDDDYVLDDVWIPTNNPDERNKYHKMTSEGVISKFYEEIKEFIEPPKTSKLVEVFKTFRLNDEMSQKICEFDYPTKKYEPPVNSGKKTPRKSKNNLTEGSKDPSTPVVNNDKPSKKILEPVRKSTRRKTRGETPDKSLEKRVTRSQNNAVKVPTYNEIKRKRKKNIKKGLLLKNGCRRYQRFFIKKRFFNKKVEVFNPDLASNYREKYFECVIEVVLNYFATNDILVDFRNRKFWDFLLSDSSQLNSLFNNRIEYVRNFLKNDSNEEELQKKTDLLKCIELAISGATKERNRRIGSDGILRNGLFKSDIIIEYQTIYEDFASKIALKEYGWKFFHFHKPKCRKIVENKETFYTSVPEKMLINRLLMSRCLSNLDKWNKYIEYCKNRNLHTFFEERTDLWNKSENITRFSAEEIQKMTLETLKEQIGFSSIKEEDEHRKLKDLIWERDYLATSDPVTRKLFNLKRELNELMYERNKILDHVLNSSIALIVRDVLDKKIEEKEEQLKIKFDATKIEKEDDLDQIPLNKEFMIKHSNEIEDINKLGKISNFLGTVTEDNQCNYDFYKTRNDGGPSSGLMKKTQVKYSFLAKDNEIFYKKYLKKKNRSNESSVDESTEFTSDKNKIAKDSHNSLKRKREFKGVKNAIQSYDSKKKCPTGIWKKIESLNKEKNTYFWRTSFEIPNVDNRLTRRGLKNLEYSLSAQNNESSIHLSPLSIPEIKNKIPVSGENQKNNETSSNKRNLNQLQKIINGEGNQKLKNSDRENKIGMSSRKRKFIT
ncbi:Hypothetical protein SRAE_X000029200 [Strongyloides ratti]|uniref:Uncharacterized protein n=1 Tax=Strongyloides ratti TaxID=34506 RepID=A0A090LTK6_STRRB|nr:Hypothetical protein SRAE_X000029200 [Strongyloides ratti]CEF70964.1 Hypothetical protein SRAE_X000029200 [Strongyloides ratti]